MDVIVLSGIGIGGPRGGLLPVYGDQSAQCGTEGHSAAAPPLSSLCLFLTLSFLIPISLLIEAIEHIYIVSGQLDNLFCEVMVQVFCPIIKLG